MGFCFFDKDLEDMLDVWYQALVIAHPFFSDEFFAQDSFVVYKEIMHEETGRPMLRM